MTSFPIIETSRHSGVPVELYLFVYGDVPGSHYAYTNAEEVVTWEGITYEPIPVDRGELSAKGTLDNSLVTITVPKTTKLAELTRVYPPSRVINLIIRQGHRATAGDTDFLVCYTGRVINSERTGIECRLGCEAIQTSMRRTGLRRHYQYGCPHVLYGPRCRANRVNYPAEVLVIDRTVITLTTDLSPGGIQPVKFTGGLFRHQGPANLDERTILKVLSRNTVLLNGPLPDMVPGSQVEVSLGCNHELNDCDDLHKNSVNFGGMPWIPFESPFGKNPF